LRLAAALSPTRPGPALEFPDLFFRFLFLPQLFFLALRAPSWTRLRGLFLSAGSDVVVVTCSFFFSAALSASFPR